MIITITGKPCSGKSSIAKILVDKYGFVRIGVGDIFKEEAKKRGMNAEEFNQYCMSDPEFDRFIDQKTAELGEKYRGQKYVFDSRCAWHFVPESFKVFVDLNEDEMVNRLLASDREGKEKYSDAKEARRSLVNRRKLENERYKMIYGIDNNDMSNFDFVMDSSSKTPEELAEDLIYEYEKYCQGVK